MAEVRVEGLVKRFGDRRALDDVSLVFPEGDLFALLGPSGSGKTTLLRAVAGFATPDAGRIRIGGKAVERIPVERREIGMMFQSYALFPNMNVFENVAFGLRVRRLPSDEIRRLVAEALALVRMPEYADRRPAQLSGGQRQRVALARAVVTRPQVLLLDEPLSALDKALRVEMQIELRRIQREVGITTIMVTHDQEEALTLSDRIGVLREGRLEQEGLPRDVYDAPESAFVARFLGDANVFEGTPAAGGLALPSGVTLRYTRPAPPARAVAVRPEDMGIHRAADDAPPGYNVIAAHLRECMFSGPTATYVLDTGDGGQVKVLLGKAAAAGAPGPGPVTLAWPSEATIPLARAD